MEKTKEIKIGNLTVSEKSLQGITVEQAKKTFHYVDARLVEAAYNKANPTAKKDKKKPVKKAK